MRKFVSILVCLMFSLSLFGCSGNSTPLTSTTPSASPASATPAASSASATPAASDTAVNWADMKPITIKFAHGYAGTELAVSLVDEWMKLVTEKTSGVVQWDYYPGASLGTITELLEQTDLGAVNCTLTDTSQLENYVSEYAILFYPFLMQSYEHQQAVLKSDIMDSFNALLEEKTNLTAIGYYINGVRNIASKRPIRNLADAKGMIMRTPEIQVYKDVATLIGMVPTTVSYSEMYTALSTGIVEAVECPNNTLYPGGYHKIAPNILKSGHMYSSCALEFNSDFWNKLPVEVQKVMKESFDSLTEAHAQKVIAADEEYYADYIKDGTTVTEWDDPNAVAAVCTDYWNTSAQKLGPDAIAIVNKIVALRK